MLYDKVAQAIAEAQSRALAYLARQQLPSGGFASLSATNPTDFSRAKTYHTTFFPSLILAALGETQDPMADKIKQKIAQFLLAQKSSSGSFNYWDRTSLAAKEQPYPDDLDDTSCAFIALYKYDQRLFDGSLLAQIANTLVACEVEPGGPYRTWLVSADSAKNWRDVDVAVNANVARTLALQGIELPNILRFVDQAIADDALHSPYYPDSFPICYFLAPWYHGQGVATLIELLLKSSKKGVWAAPTQAALAITALLQLGYPAGKLTPAIHQLLSSQQPNGSWPAGAFCIDPSQGSQRAYAGSTALSTALCIEALSHYAQATVVPVVPRVSQRRTNAVYSQVIASVAAVVDRLPSAELRHQTNVILRRILQQDTDHQIVLLPSLIARAAGVKPSQKVIMQLGEASLWGWMAYTVYDDFLDGEGEPKLLPSANLCLRNLVDSLRGTLADNKQFQIEITSILNQIDAANTWELLHCRGSIRRSVLRIKELPEYGRLQQLADRSLGHMIAGLGVLYAAELRAQSQPMRALKMFFRHYLIARQLNDDLHDWEEDLAIGHLNVAGVAVVKEWQRKTKQSIRNGLNLQTEAGLLQTLLWERVVPKLCRQILGHTQQARAAINKIAAFDGTVLEPLLATPERAAQQALAGRQDTLAFIRTLQA